MIKRIAVFVLLVPITAQADNCSGFRDCFNTLQTALSTAVGLALIAMLTVVKNAEAILKSDALQRILGIVPVPGSSPAMGMSSREGAYLGTAKFPPGTVGYGVHYSIGTISGLLQDFGEAKIGDLFNRPDVQALLAKENTWENNYQVAQLEYNYWADVLTDPNQSFENRVGGFVGVAFEPLVRSDVQIGVGWAAENLEQARSYATDYIIDPVILTVQNGVDQAKAFAQHRMEYLRSKFSGR